MFPTIEFYSGKEIDFEGLAERLVGFGYSRVAQVGNVGDFSIRGGIIDVFPVNFALPVRMELDPNCSRVLGDAQQLRQVMHNLLQNAQDSTETAARTGPGHEVVIKTQSADNARRVRLSVIDCGTGFPEHILKRAFEPYVTTKAKGTGLGLAVVKKIADEHGSRVDITNRIVDGQILGAQVSLSFAIENVVLV
jgi:nitrogen fixation/metabolism regulation signal transduction histidine kinase